MHGILASTTSTAGNPGPRPSLEEWQRISTYSEEAMGRIAAEQRTIDSQKNDIQSKQTVFERQLNELRTARGRQSKTITVRVALTTPGRLEVALRYSIPNASWSPAYDARFHNADRAVELSYFGVVKNGTGEDWKDIVLTLSTARPSLGGAPAELRPWITEVQRPRSPASAGSSTFASTVINPDLVGEARMVLAPVDAELGRGNGQVQIQTRDLPMVGNNVLDLLAVSPGLSGRAAAPAPPAQTSAVLSTAGIESTITSATFKIPGTVSVPGNNINQKIAIKQTRLPATLQYQSTPRVLEAAFLNASASNSTDYPLLAGPMNTFLDDTFVTVSSLKSVMPGEKFDLALGVDDGVSVKRRIVNRFTEDTGLTNKTRRITYEINVTVTNNKTTTERFMFKELTPVSHDEKIVVKLQSPQEKEVGTATNPKEITREEEGKLVWRISLKPGEKREFVLKLSVEHPSDLAVTGLD